VALTEERASVAQGSELRAQNTGQRAQHVPEEWAIGSSTCRTKLKEEASVKICGNSFGC